MNTPSPRETGTGENPDKQSPANDDRSRSARLVIADDHYFMRVGLRLVLNAQADLTVVGEAENGLQAIELCRRLVPDLVLMDIQMPVMGGLEATRAIKEEHPTVSVLVLTSHEDPSYLFEAIKTGASGYVLKDAPKARLIDTVRRTLQDESPLNQELAMQLLRRLAVESDRRVEPHAPGVAAQAPATPEKGVMGRAPGSLTVREVEVLRLLAVGKTNRQIAEELVISLSTVKRHVEHIITKLEVSDRTQAAVRAVQLGLHDDR